MSIFFLVLCRMNKTDKKILKNNDQLEENANFGHFEPFLACFWPIMAPVYVLKGLNEYISPSSEWNEGDWRKNSE